MNFSAFIYTPFIEDRFDVKTWAHRSNVLHFQHNSYLKVFCMIHPILQAVHLGSLLWWLTVRVAWAWGCLGWRGVLKCGISSARTENSRKFRTIGYSNLHYSDFRHTWLVLASVELYLMEPDTMSPFQWLYIPEAQLESRPSGPRPSFPSHFI